MPSVGARLKVSGYVQGVGFRYYCYQKAVDLGLAGWVRNEPDSSVAVTVEGERGLIEELIATLRVGPPASSVTDVIVQWDRFSGRYDAFQITRSY